MKFWSKISYLGLDDKLNQSQKRKIILTNRLIYFSFVTVLTFIPLLYTLNIDAPIIPTLIMLFICLISFYLAKVKKHQLSLLLLVLVQISYVITLNSTTQLSRVEHLGVILHLFLIPATLAGIVLLKKLKHSVLLAFIIILIYLSIEAIKEVNNLDKIAISTPFYILYIFDVVIIFFSIYYYISQFKSIDDGYTIDIINQQKEINNQHIKLSKAYNDIKESIDYAQKIQSALLPTSKLIKKHIKDHFLLYLPKDTVAGDFYWIESKQDFKYIAIADCTGHGVPGALVSIVCINALNRALFEHNLSTTNQILNKTRQIIIEEFNQSNTLINDGMDISLLKVPIKTKSTNYTIEFSGANNPLYLIRNNILLEFQGCKQPIGKHIKIEPFKAQQIEVNNEDKVFLFTDGFADQFGGIKGKKFKKKPFKDLLLEISNLPPNQQLIKLKNTLKNWKEDIEQVDDITILGFKL